MRYLCAIAWFVCACSSVPVKEEKPRPEVDMQAISLLADSCDPVEVEKVVKPGKAICDIDPLRRGLLGCVGYLEAMGLCRNDLKACRAMNQIDVAELQAQVDFQRREKDAAESARWWWGLGGVGIGALLTGLLVGLLR